MLLLFPATPLPAPLTAYDLAIALPNFTNRVAQLRNWPQCIASLTSKPL